MRGSVVPARLGIVGWILLTTLLGLAAVVVTVRSALLADVARAANADVVQEVQEFREFAREGRNPETAAPFTSTGALLEVYLRRQRAGEVLIGYDRGTNQVIRIRQTGADDRDPYDLTRDARVFREVVDSAATSGVIQTEVGRCAGAAWT